MQPGRRVDPSKERGGIENGLNMLATHSQMQPPSSLVFALSLSLLLLLRSPMSFFKSPEQDGGRWGQGSELRFLTSRQVFMMEFWSRLGESVCGSPSTP